MPLADPVTRSPISYSKSVEITLMLDVGKGTPHAARMVKAHLFCQVLVDESCVFIYIDRQILGRINRKSGDLHIGIRGIFL